MTREEAIKIFEQNKKILSIPNACAERQLEAIDMAIEALSVEIPLERVKEIIDEIESTPSAEKVGKWIPVDERLPKKEGHYLVYAPYYSGGSSTGKENHDGVMFSKFKNGKWSIEHGYYKRPNCVQAWMPLPVPCKAGDAE